LSETLTLPYVIGSDAAEADCDRHQNGREYPLHGYQSELFVFFLVL